MTRHQHRTAATATAVASIALGLLLAAPARGASLTEVARATWGATGVPSYVQMYIYVPDKLATKPPIMVSAHSCGSTATGQMGNIPKIKAAADANGFILILPDNPGQNCWDVGSTQALKHDGGGDTQAIAQMVKYTLTKYNGDAARVYIMGGSSGAMLTQAMLAVYPDVFRAGSARAGVAAGCWADGYASSNQWSNNCAGGNTTKTAQQWGDLVRNMYPGYTGHRPRVQIMQGTADTTISYKNTAESVKEWTNVLGLSTTPTSSDSGFKAANATYNRELWKNACGYTVLEAWSSPNGTHSMPYEEADVLKFFGLDTAGGSDPEPTCSGDGGVGGANGAAGASGSGGTTGAGGARDGGVDAGAVMGMAGRGGGSGSGDSGAAGSGGGAGTGNAGGSGGTGAMGGNNATAGTGGSAVITGAAGTGSVSSGGRGGQSNGGTTGIAGAAGPGGSPGGGGSGTPGDGPSDGGGCDGCFIGGDAGRPAPTLAVVVVAALGLVLRRQRRRRF